MSSSSSPLLIEVSLRLSFTTPFFLVGELLFFRAASFFYVSILGKFELLAYILSASRLAYY